MLNGKTYMNPKSDRSLIVAFEKSEQGDKDLERFKNNKLRSFETGELLTYDMNPISLKELNEK